MSILIAIGTDPSIDEDEIGDKRRYGAFQYGRVTTNDVFGYHFGFVVLIDDLKLEKKDG